MAIYSLSEKGESDIKPTNSIQVILSIIVIVIGIFMVVRYIGSALPPAMSGIAFILIGIVLLMNKKAIS